MKTKKVIELSASWCQPCKVFAKTFNAVSKKDEFSDITFETHDIEESEEIEKMAEKYGIQSVPTTLLFDENGELLKRVSGNLPLSALEDEIRNS